MGEEPVSKSMTSATTIIYEDLAGNKIIYYYLETEYFGTDYEFNGLNENAFKCVLNPLSAQEGIPCKVGEYDWIIYEAGEHSYLCWSISAEQSCVIEYDKDVFSEDLILVMAESVG